MPVAVGPQNLRLTRHCDETCEDETHTQEGTPKHDDKFQKELEELRSQNERLIMKLQNENLLTETHSLARQLRQKEAAPKKIMFSLANIKSSDSLVEFYTGFQDHKTLLAFCEEALQDDARVMR